MGVFGLLSYIVEHKDKTTVEVNLAEKENVVLFCDLPNVVRRLEQNILYSQVHSLPDVCGFYGGDLKLLAQQFNNFITAFKHLRIKVIFVNDAPFGADEDDFHQKLEEKNRRQRGKHQVVEDWSKWRGAVSKKKPYLRCSLAVGVCCKVLVDREEELVMSHTEADHWIISHFKERKAFGVLSDDSDFVVSRTTGFIPLKLFEMEGFHEGSINPEPRSLICRYTDSTCLSQSLKINEDQLIHLAIICGNDFTKNFNVYEDIGICVTGEKAMQIVVEVSRWLQYNDFHTDVDLKKRRNDQDYVLACDYSEAFYRGRLNESESIRNYRFLDRVQKYQLTPWFLSIENGRCWMEFLPEPLELCGKAHELTKRLRKVLYSLCSCTHVVESGKIQNKVMCEEVVKVKSTPIYCRRHFPTMVARLCQTTAGTKYKWFEECTHEYQCYLSDRSLVRGAVIASTLNYVLSNYPLAAELDHKFKMCFLFAVATCSLDLSTDREILEMQRSAPKTESWIQQCRYVNSSTVSLSAIFMATLPIVYNIAAFLGLTNYLPNTADIFSPAIFVPTMTQCLMSKYGNTLSLSPPQLLELNTFVADCSSTVTIRNLCSFASQFENAVNFVRTELHSHKLSGCM